MIKRILIFSILISFVYSAHSKNISPSRIDTIQTEYDQPKVNKHINLSDLESELEFAFKQNDLITCFILIGELEEREKYGDIYCSNGNNQRRCTTKEISQVKASEVYRRASKDKEIFDYYWKKPDQEGQWKPIVDLPSKKIYHQLEAGNSVETFKTEVVVDSNYLKFFQIFTEMHLYPKFISFMKFAEKFQGPNSGRFVGQIRGDCFWPLKSRETIVEFQYFPIEEENAFGMVFSSLYETKWFGTEIRKDHKTVAMDINRGFSLIWPLDEEKTKIVTIFTLDPHLEYVPKFVLNFGTRYIIPMLIDYGLQVLKKTPKNIEDLIKETFEQYAEMNEIGKRFIEISKVKQAEEEECSSKRSNLNLKTEF